MKEPQVTFPLSVLRAMYFTLGQVATTAAADRKSLQGMILEAMGGESEVDAGDGWRFVKQVRLNQTYTREALAKVFDEDAIALCMTIDKKKVADLIKTMKIPASQVRELDKSMITLGQTEALVLKPPTKETMA